MPKGFFGLRSNSKKEEAALRYTKICSPRQIERETGSRQMNVLHEVHERGFPVYNFANGNKSSRKKANISFLIVDVDDPKPFAQCVKTDENGNATMAHVDMVALGLPVVHLNLVQLAVLPCTLYRAADALKLKLTNAISGKTTTSWARGELSSFSHEYGIPKEHWNLANSEALKGRGLEPEKPFSTLGSRVYGIRISSYE